ncbi:MAG: class I tRNA ligase family protein, partial [Bacteroidota bacterium]
MRKFMAKQFKRHTITAALPYANGPVHVGHLAGVYIPADIYVRYLRSKGEDVAFICGSDEHGVAIELRARKEGKTPQEVVDFYHDQIKSSFAEFGISFNIYHRTSDPLHHQTASEFFEKGAVGYSPDKIGETFDGLELKTYEWKVRPLTVSEVRSTFFEDETIFPK